MALSAAIIGGGISGLASALRVANLGHRVTLIEGENFLGGLGTTFPYGGDHLERFYHCILPDDTALLAFIRELGLEDDLLWRATHMGFMYQRQIYPLNTAIDLLRFSPLTFAERVRLGLMGLKARNQGASVELDGVTAEHWVRGMVGDRVFDILWKPLLSAKIGDHYPALPALWLSSRMSREKSSQKEVKGCLRRGYKSLIDAFAGALRERGVDIRFDTRVETIERDGEAMELIFANGQRETYDFVVSTSPLVQFQRMTKSLGIESRIADLKLDYQGVVSGVFLLDTPITKYYWMPFVDSGATAQGMIEMSNLVPLERSRSLYVTYLVNYTHRDTPLYQESDQEILKRYRADMNRLFPNPQRHIVDQYVFRAPFVEPIWTVNYGQARPPSSVIPGRLYLACTAQVYPRVNSWNSCCEVVEGMIPRLAAETATIEGLGQTAIA